MDFGLPFSFAFQDQNWFKKLAIAGLISLIPIIGWIYLLGWGLEITRQLIFREPVNIPENDFSKFLGRGFKAFVISLVYSIPSMIFQIPNSIVSVAAQNASNDDGSGALVGGMAAIAICSGLLAAIYGLLLAFVMPAVYALFLKNNEEIGAGFRFGEIFALIKKAPVAYLLAVVGGIIAGMISSLGVIACIIGLLITIPYSLLIMSHFYGQAYLEATKI
jgi:hypothetical protein